MKKKTFRIGLLLLLAAQLALLFCYGAKKQGFHEDEYFSYYSPNRTNGFYYVDREWVDTEVLRQEFVAEEGTGFRFDNVKLYTSWDVHPPLYYALIHLASSLSPGVFSKWQGLLVNMACFVVLQGFLAAFAWELTASPAFCLLCVAVCGFLPGRISGVLFVRMYEMLGALIMASLYFHARLFRSADRRTFLLRLIPAATVSALGFLTQYFFLFFLAPAGAFTLGFLLSPRGQALQTEPSPLRERLQRGVFYVLSQGLGLGLAVLIFPASLRQIFGGYRGKDAAAGLFSVSDTLGRLAFFGRLLDRFGFAGFLLPPLLLVLILCAGRLLRHWTPLAKRVPEASPQRQGQNASASRSLPAPSPVPAALWLLTAGTVGYFFFAAKAGLVLGDASFRYIQPATSLTALSILALLYFLLPAGTKTLFLAALYAALLLCTAIARDAVAEEGILFLYREDAQKIAFARAHNTLPVVVAYHHNTPYNIWYLSDELLEHRALYYIDSSSLSPIEDERLCSADDLLVYLADSDHAEALLRSLAACGQDAAPRTASPVSREAMWTLYLLQSPD